MTAMVLRAHIIKNKSGGRIDKYRTCDYYMHTMYGIDRVRSLLIQLAKPHKLVTVSGSWYGFNTEKLPDLKAYRTQGEDAFIAKISNLPLKEREEILQSVLQALKWGEAKDASITPKSKGTVIEDAESGDVTKVASVERINEAAKKETVMEKAEVLGLVQKKGRKFFYRKLSHMNLQKLWDLMKEEDRVALSEQVDEMMESGEATVSYESTPDEDLDELLGGGVEEEEDDDDDMEVKVLVGMEEEEDEE
jgi:hypothetical protein